MMYGFPSQALLKKIFSSFNCSHAGYDGYSFASSFWICYALEKEKPDTEFGNFHVL